MLRFPVSFSSRCGHRRLLPPPEVRKAGGSRLCKPQCTELELPDPRLVVPAPGHDSRRQRTAQDRNIPRAAEGGGLQQDRRRRGRLRRSHVHATSLGSIPGRVSCMT